MSSSQEAVITVEAGVWATTSATSLFPTGFSGSSLLGENKRTPRLLWRSSLKGALAGLGLRQFGDLARLS